VHEIDLMKHKTIENCFFNILSEVSEMIKWNKTTSNWLLKTSFKLINCVSTDHLYLNLLKEYWNINPKKLFL